jgi:hypothetical protein
MGTGGTRRIAAAVVGAPQTAPIACLCYALGMAGLRYLAIN